MSKGKALGALLDMSDAARMQRAKDLGFDTSRPVFHGNESGSIDGDEFDMSRTGENFSVPWRDNIFFGDRRLAEHYGDVSGPYYARNPLVINAKERLVSDWENAKTGESFEDWLQGIEDSFGIYGFMEQGFSHFADEARAAGKGSVFVDFSGLPVREKHALFTWDPKNVRSAEAAFDPEQRGSSNLLAGLAGALPAAGIGLGGLIGDPAASQAMSVDQRANLIPQGRNMQISSPEIPGLASAADYAGGYNAERSLRASPALDFLAPVGSLPEEYLRKLAYGQDVGWRDRIGAILGLL